MGLFKNLGQLVEQSFVKKARVVLTLLSALIFVGTIAQAQFVGNGQDFRDLPGVSIEDHPQGGGMQADDFVPYPFGSEMPFPWKLIQGVWYANAKNFTSYYSFQVVRERSSHERQLLIKQYNSNTCDLIASGVGIERGLKTIWAQMKPVYSNRAYRLGLRSFSVDDLPKDMFPSVEGHVMVMSIAPVDSVLSQHMPLSKISGALMSKINKCQASEISTTPGIIPTQKQ